MSNFRDVTAAPGIGNRLFPAFPSYRPTGFDDPERIREPGFTGIQGAIVAPRAHRPGDAVPFDAKLTWIKENKVSLG